MRKNDKMAYKSQLLATEKYNKKKYDFISFRMLKGYKDIIDRAAGKTGLSISGYINKAVIIQLEKDGFKPEEPQAGDAAAAGDTEGETGEKQ